MKKLLTILLMISLASTSVPFLFAAENPPAEIAPAEHKWVVGSSELYPDGSSTSTLLSYEGSGGDLVIPDDLGIKYIGEDVIPDGLKGLITSINIPSCVIRIGDGAFCELANMTKLTIAESVEYIGSHAFMECLSLKRVRLPANLNYIGDQAFFRCSSLESVYFPDGLYKISHDVFMGCPNLLSVYIPPSAYVRHINSGTAIIGYSDERWAMPRDTVYYPVTIYGAKGSAVEKWVAVMLGDSKFQLSFIEATREEAAELAPLTNQAYLDNPPSEASARTATPKATKVEYNQQGIGVEPETPIYVPGMGESTNFGLNCDTFLINGANYILLHQFARLMVDKVAIGYDADINAITLTTGQKYARYYGKESPADTDVVSATLSNVKVYIDGVETELTAYNIGGSNYFKLKDLAKALDYGLEWQPVKIKPLGGLDIGVIIYCDKLYTDD